MNEKQIGWDDAAKCRPDNQIDAEKVRVEPTCLWCNNKMYFYYEGSHDWVFSCQTCQFEKNFYVKHLGDENRAASNKWFEWVRKVQSCTPVSLPNKSDDKEVEKASGTGTRKISYITELMTMCDILDPIRANQFQGTAIQACVEIRNLQSELHALKANYVLQEPVGDEEDCESLQNLRSQLTLAQERIKTLEEALMDIEANYDHEDPIRGIVPHDFEHNHCYCRRCKAEAALQSPPSQE